MDRERNATEILNIMQRAEELWEPGNGEGMVTRKPPCRLHINERKGKAREWDRVTRPENVEDKSSARQSCNEVVCEGPRRAAGKRREEEWRKIRHNTARDATRRFNIMMYEQMSKRQICE